MAIRTKREKKLKRIDGKYGRTYTLPDGSVVPSVTSILSALSKPYLIPWAAKQERELVMQSAATLWQTEAVLPDRDAYLTTLAQTVGEVKAHARELTAACDIGSQIHARIEQDLLRELGQNPPLSDPLSYGAAFGYNAFRRFRGEHELRPIYAERQVWSVQHQYAGTMDWYGVLDGVLTVGDWKSSKQISSEAHLQVAAYTMALIELGLAVSPVQAAIIRLPKTADEDKVEIQILSWPQLVELFRIFLLVQQVYAWQRKKV